MTFNNFQYSPIQFSHQFSISFSFFLIIMKVMKCKVKRAWAFKTLRKKKNNLFHANPWKRKELLVFSRRLFIIFINNIYSYKSNNLNCFSWIYVLLSVCLRSFRICEWRKITLSVTKRKEHKRNVVLTEIVWTRSNWFNCTHRMAALNATLRIVNILLLLVCKCDDSRHFFQQHLSRNHLLCIVFFYFCICCCQTVFVVDDILQKNSTFKTNTQTEKSIREPLDRLSFMNNRSSLMLFFLLFMFLNLVTQDWFNVDLSIEHILIV